MTDKLRRHVLHVLCIASFLLAHAIEGYGQGSLLLHPRRLTFEGDTRVREINVANNGKDTARYMVSLTSMKMNEDGTFVPASDSASDLLSHIKIYPKHVILAPGEAQVIKVQRSQRSSGKLAAGEYRAHLSLKPIPKAKSAKRKMTTKIKLKVTPVFSFTVPIILRVGAYDARATIQDMSFSNRGDTLPQLTFTINRTGTMSVHGDIHINLVSPEGRSTSVATLYGFSVYAPYPKRQFTINLSRKGVSYKQGQLQVSCLTQVEERSVKIAENVLHLQ